MTDSTQQQEVGDLSRFEFWVGELIETCEQLKAENVNLRHEYAALLDENNQLLSRNNHVAQRLEILIGRLKKMELV